MFLISIFTFVKKVVYKKRNKQTNKQKQQQKKKKYLEIRIELPSKEENAKIEISPIIVEAIIRKCSI